MQLDDKVYKPSAVQLAISTAKNALISPDAYISNRELMEADKRARRPLLAEIYRAYVNRCKVAGAMDFDDLLYYTNLLLRDNPDILNHYREFFRYILVDEYQDTNFAQHLIISQLGNGSDNLCVVGDDAQSIYSFRGANIKNILNLRNAYPNLATFKLEQNYRSTQNIINAANSLIEKNKFQIPKKVFSKNDEGQRIEVVDCYSDLEEGSIVANRITERKIESGSSYEDFAILYRTNAQSRVLEESLRKRNIPYRIYGGLSFYQRKEIKDAIAYMRLSVNPNDDEALRRIINFPARGIGETTLNKLIRAAIENQCSIWDVLCNIDGFNVNVNSGTKKKLDGFRELIESFIKLNNEGADAEEVTVKIIRDTRLLSELIHDHTPESVSKQENLKELLSGVKEFVETRREAELDATTSLGEYLGQISLLTDQDQEDATGERVTMMTVHAAKGLEFGNVFIVGAEEELFPSAMAMGSPAEIEEERRLMYVAITRAKYFCMISHARSRYRNGQTVTSSPSRFLREVNPRYIRLSNNDIYGSRSSFNPVDNYRSSFHSPIESGRGVDRSKSYSRFVSPPSTPKPTSPPASSGEYDLHQAGELHKGMTIRHERFGEGVIEDIDSSTVNQRIVVRFKNVDTKTLLLKFARFKIIE